MIRCRAYVGLGSNLEQPVTQVRQAIQELANLPDSRFIVASRLYRSAPMGPQDQPDYINAVAAIDTGLAPESLLDQLQSLEQAHRRIRERRWGPRTLDLDLLLYADRTIATDRLIVPHPGIAERSFVLLPLYDIAPNLQMPDGTPLATLVANCPSAGIEPLM